MSTVTRAVALDELEIVAGNIAGLQVDLAQTLAAEHEAKVTAWFASDSSFIGERDRIAEHNSLNLSLDVIRLKGDLAAAESRRSFLEFVIHWGA